MNDEEMELYMSMNMQKDEQEQARALDAYHFAFAEAQENKEAIESLFNVDINCLGTDELTYYIQSLSEYREAEQRAYDSMLEAAMKTE